MNAAQTQCVLGYMNSGAWPQLCCSTVLSEMWVESSVSAFECQTQIEHCPDADGL